MHACTIPIAGAGLAWPFAQLHENGTANNSWVVGSWWGTTVCDVDDKLATVTAKGY